MSEQPPIPDPNQDPNLDPNAHNIDPADPNVDPDVQPDDSEQEPLPKLEQVPLLREPYEHRTQTPPTPEELKEFEGLLTEIWKNADYRHNIKNNLKANPDPAKAAEASKRFWEEGKGGAPSRRDVLVGRMSFFLQRHPDFEKLALKDIEGHEGQLAKEKESHFVASEVRDLGASRLADAEQRAPGYKSVDDPDYGRPEFENYRYMGIGPKVKTVRRLPKFTHGVMELTTSVNPNTGKEELDGTHKAPRSYREDVRRFYGDGEAHNYEFVGDVEKQRKAWLAAQAKYNDDPANNNDPGPWNPKLQDRNRPAGFSRESAATRLADDRILQAHLQAVAARAEGHVSKAENRVSTLADVLTLAKEKKDEQIQNLEATWGPTSQTAELLEFAAIDSITTYRTNETLPSEYARKHIELLNNAARQITEVDELLKDEKLSVTGYDKLVRRRAELSWAYVHSRMRYHTAAIASGDRTATYTIEKGIAINDGSNQILFADGSHAYGTEQGIIADRRNPDGSAWNPPSEIDSGENFEVEGGLSTQELKDRQFAAFTEWFMNQSDPELRKRALAHTNELASALYHDAQVEGDLEASRLARMQRYWSDYIAKQEYEPAENYSSIWPDGGIVNYRTYYGREGWWASYPDGSLALNEQDDNGISRTIHRYDPYGNELPLN